MTPADYVNKWYDSNVNHWGCKWDVSIDGCSWEFNEDIITATFDTAWSPPIGFCQKLAEFLLSKSFSRDCRVVSPARAGLAMTGGLNFLTPSS